MSAASLHPLRPLAAFRQCGALRTIAAALGVLALSLQFWLPLVHHPARSPDESLVSWWLAGALCHVDVGGPVGDESVPKRGPGKAPDDNGTVCPICLGLHICSTFVLPVFTAVLAVLAVPAVLRFRSPGTIGIVRRTSAAAQPRAPPPTV